MRTLTVSALSFLSCLSLAQVFFRGDRRDDEQHVAGAHRCECVALATGGALVHGAGYSLRLLSKPGFGRVLLVPNCAERNGGAVSRPVTLKRAVAWQC